MKKIYFIIISLLLFSCQKEIIEYELNIIKSPSEGGVFYSEGTNLSVVAEPNSEYEFLNWTGDIESSSSTISFEINSDLNLTANFERWDILGVYVWPNPVYELTYEQEVERLENWIEERMNWLNSNF